MREYTRRRVFGGNAGHWLVQKRYRSKEIKGRNHTKNSDVGKIDKSSEDVPVHFLNKDRDQGSNFHFPIQLSGKKVSSIDATNDCSGNPQWPAASLSQAGVTHLANSCIELGIVDTGKKKKRRAFSTRKRHFTSCCGDNSSADVTGSQLTNAQQARKKYDGGPFNQSVLCTQLSTTSQVSVPLSLVSYDSETSSLSEKGNEIPVTSIKTSLPNNGIIGTTDPANSSTYVNNVRLQSSCACDPSVALRPISTVRRRNRGTFSTQKDAMTNLIQGSESSSVFNFDKDSGKYRFDRTCDVDVARQFFSRLDSDETLLTIEDVRHNPEPLSTRKQYSIIRTSRCNLQPNKAKEEYRKYCQMCRLSKIKPFSMVRFMEQRSEHFRVGEIYDGMFDE